MSWLMFERKVLFASLGAVRVSKRFFEECFLLELFADLLIDIA